MKKGLFVFGIVLLLVGIVALLLGLLFMHASTHTLDGSAGLYSKQRSMMCIAFLVGAVVLIAGIILIVFSGKIK